MNDLTIEQELDLIKGRKTPQQIATETQPPAPPAVDPVRKTPEQIAAELGLPPPTIDLTPVPASDAGTWDILGAAWRTETIRTDSWNDAANRRRQLTESMWSLLPETARTAVNDAWRKGYAAGGWPKMTDLILAEAGRQASASPEAAAQWAGYPLSREAFDQQINAARRADYDEAQAILDQPGGEIAEFLGTAARAMTDETSLMLLPFGISGSAWRMILGEAVLGGIGEAAVLPKEYKVAGELGLPEPNPIARIALGVGTGGVFSAAIIGLGKGARALMSLAKAHRASIAATKPDGTAGAAHQAELDAAEAELRGDQTPQERLGGMGGGERAEAPPDGTLGAILDKPAPGALPPVGPDAPPNWERIRNGIFAGESGADWNALFGYQNRKGGKFSHIKPTQMTVDQWLAFQDPKGEYGQWVKANRPDPENGVATPMGAYQIVGDTLRRAKKALGLKGDEVMTPEMQDYIAQWIYRQQGTGAWVGYKGPRDSYTPGSVDGPAPQVGPTSRGYTGNGQVKAGDDFTIDVDWEVVDATSLLRASGDLQPRDRSRVASDTWIADTAARLEPAQLMPSPTADRGTPIVGPDNVIESGNGRFAAIERAYAMHPDRAAAYRSAIEAAGFAVPEGVERPVLIARRRTELTPDQRRQLVIDAQDSGVAVMTPTEMALVQGRAMTAPVLARLDPALPLRDAANGDFVRAALAALPRSQRNAMFDKDGFLNAAGAKQLKDAMFARAWPDEEIIARYTEGDPGELKTLLEALERAAPSWAALKADIEAGLVAPEMDIGPFVLDAMRLIGKARDLAAAEQARRAKAPKGQRSEYSIADAVAELLDEVDLLEGAISPLTAALVRKFWTGGKAARAEDVAAFLTRYADDARKAGAAGGLFDAPSPRDVLRAIDPETFGELPENLGQPRGARATTEAPPEAVADLPEAGFDQGARSPEAEAAGIEIEAELRGGGTQQDPPRPDPDNPSLIDTRGQGVRYHGSIQPIDRLTDDYIGSEKNFYGQGFYSSDAAAITVGYSRAKKSTTGVVYRIEESGQIKPLDMEQPIPDWFRTAVDTRDGSAAADLIAEALGENPANLREFYDAVRDLSPNYQLPTYEVQQIFDGFAEIVRKNGFNVLDHIGGLRTKKTPHAVRIYLEPSATVRLHQVDSASLQAKNAAPDASPPPAAAAAPAEAMPTPGATPIAETANASVRAAAPRRGIVERVGRYLNADTRAVDQARRDLGAFAEAEIDMPDGTTIRAGDLLDDIEADRQFDAFLQACAIATPNGAAQ